MFLPMSCTSPLTVHRITLPCARTPSGPSRSFSCSMNGSRYATARFIARALLTTCGRNIFPAPNRSPTTCIPAISGPSITSSGRSRAVRASSVSCSMNSSIPCTSACLRRSSTVVSRHERSSSFFMAPPLTVSANATMRSVASGRRSKMMSSTCSSRSGGMSSYSAICPAFTIAMSRPAAIAWYRNAEWIASRTRVVPAEAEREVRDAAGDLDARQPLLEQPRGLDERRAVGVVLLDPGRDRQDARVDDDVLGHEAGPVDQQADRALEDLELALDGVGLSLLVERHHDDRRPVPLDATRLLEEVLLALLQADRVDDALALQALQPGLEHVPLGRVDHHRDARDLGLGGDQVQERRHGLHAVEQVGVHVDVEHVRAAADLVGRDLDGGLVVAGLDQPAEPSRAGHVLPLADHHEPGLRRDREGLEPAQRRHGARRRDLAGREPVDGGGDLADVLVGRPAAPAEHVRETALGELAQVLRGGLGALVVAAERVGQAGVRVAGGEHRRDPRQRFEVRPHLGRPERAVHADAEGFGVRDREPERVDRLTRRASGRSDR